ncbi:xanthine dehydrogenase family protein molybdopterin-binding subunit [Bosea rubneri]|uniref:Molybdopterin cofactor-binding domain-containing protein n=1 Tax=Bosea rubneri TaxID=3075434 RepID=A0ABU3S1K5_9HYPH|nr:molybdopterin cofactor-binding domain-containing protein [Bosea sp. ZW T0_25]MDU0338673.1 molybdopterin cofactor-binding domain-containing protein [Bosea sp. ZW T0_25]
MNIQMSRRRLLKGSGALVVGFTLAGRAGEALAQGASLPAAKPLAVTEVDAFLSIDIDGIATVYSGKVDLGTGVATALPQIVAEELDLPMAAIRFIQGDTGLTPDQGISSGSLAIQNGGIQLRQAAATARNALLDEAARRLQVARGELSVVDGVVEAKSGQSVSYGALIGGKSFNLKLDPKKPVATKAPKDFKVVGKSVARIDIPGKVTGQFTYMQDVRVPGMVHARVVRPPALGARLESVDERSIAGIPGVTVVRQKDFLAVVSPSEWNAVRASQQLAVKWSKSETLPEQAKLWDHVRSTKVVKDDVTSNIGDVAAAMGKDGRTLSATYDFAINLHGSIGPSCGIAEFKDGKLTCWSASQATHNLRKQLAEMFSMPAEDVRCIYFEGAGCYGRNGHEDATADAALIAKLIGMPVRVQWSRADEHGWEPMGPPTLIDLKATLSDKGEVTAWDSRFFVPQGMPGNCPLVAQELAGLPAPPVLSPGNVIRNSDIPYGIPNIRTICHRLETTPFRPSWIRAPGRMQNTFANECFLDELAAAANVDPLAFRLKYLDDKRGIELLERLRAFVKWEARASPLTKASGTSAGVLKGRGVSYTKYEKTRTYVGVVAEVEVNTASGAVRTTRFHVVHDCGQIINPDGVISQIEGNIHQTVSRTMKEEVHFDRAMSTSLDWASYPIMTFPEMADIRVELIDRPDQAPWGAGEPTAAVVPSAISNAIFDATGARLRSTPFIPQKVKAALTA